METRGKILIHASQMFISLGVKNVTMDLLASEMGISKRTIYEQFKNKNELVIESIIHMMQEANKVNMTIIAEAAHVVEALFLIMKYQEERRKKIPVVFQEDIKKYFPEARSRTIKDKSGIYKISAPITLLQKGVDQGIFRPDLNLELVDIFLFEMISITHNSQLISVLSPEPKDLFTNILLPYFRGLCTAKGVELMHTYFDNYNPLL
jgi:TetR/AcrR family transcriptional regulator, cholesterol catabolism regulator